MRFTDNVPCVGIPTAERSLLKRLAPPQCASRVARRIGRRFAVGRGVGSANPLLQQSLTMKISGIESSPLRGIACMVAGFALLTLNDAVLKWLTASYPTGQIVFMRSIFVMILVWLIALRFGGLRTLRVVNLRGQLVRAGTMTVATLLFVTSLRLMPLADAVAIAFSAPLFVTALAGPLLGEHVGWRRWVAVLVGFGGVLVMFRPTGETVRLVALLPLCVAFRQCI